MENAPTICRVARLTHCNIAHLALSCASRLLGGERFLGRSDKLQWESLRRARYYVAMEREKIRQEISLLCNRAAATDVDPVCEKIARAFLISRKILAKVLSNFFVAQFFSFFQSQKKMLFYAR